MENAIHFPVSLNFRDVGGVATKTGRLVARGRFYRSADLIQLGSEGASLLAGTIGLRTVVDLRTSCEVSDHGTPAVSPTCRHLHCPLFECVQPEWIALADASAQATATRYLKMLRAGTETLVQIVRTLGDNDAQPFLIHCVAGRDRTRIFAACLLDLLGVADEVIASDYALSDEIAEDGGRAQEQTMLRFLQLLRKEHGSTAKLLRMRGVSDEELSRFSHCLLTV